MELQVQIPSHPPSPPQTTFDFRPAFIPTTTADNNSNSSYCSSPAHSACSYLSAPSSPPHHHTHHRHPLNLCFYSAPGSPTASTIIPFNWETIPGIPKQQSETESTHCNPDDDDDDFEFDFSGQLVQHPPSTITAADELFHGGKIRPLKPPPGVQSNTIAHQSSLPKSSSSASPPRSPIAKFRGAFSPRRRKEEQERVKGFLDPFETALERSRKSDFSESSRRHNGHVHGGAVGEQQRGRSGAVKGLNSSANNQRKGISRSLSPLRVSEFALLMQQQQQQDDDDEERQQQQQQQRPLSSSSNYGSYSSTSSSNSSSSSWSYRKWRLKDLFLFRSASEGRATDHKSNQYYNSSKVEGGGVAARNSSASIMCSDRSSVGSTSSRRRTSSNNNNNNEVVLNRNNRGISGELRRKKTTTTTSLPYKYGLLGCLGFNPLTSGFGFQQQDASSVSSRGFSGGSTSFMRQ